jgi:hypothetical protein
MKANSWFDCGWNDTVNGLKHCDTVIQLLAYIATMRKFGQMVRTDYAKGCLAAIKFALENGKFPERRN